MTDQSLAPITLLELDIDTCGNNYGAAPCAAGVELDSGTSQAGATENSIVLAATASAVDDTFNGETVTTEDGREAIVIDYDGPARIATVDRRWPTNQFIRSEDFDDAVWEKRSVTVEGAARIGPNGLDAMAKIVDTADAGTLEHDLRQQPAGHYVVGVAYTITAWFAPGEYQFAFLDFPNNRFPPGAGAHFDLVNGTITRLDPAGTIATITRDNFGTFRCSATSVCAIAGGAKILLGATQNGENKPYEGIEGSGVYVFGATLEALDHVGPYVRSEAAEIGVPSLTDYRVLQAGGECYKTFPTCQDRGNFLRHVRTWSFVSEGARPPAGEMIRPYIAKTRFAATEIDIEKGLGPRGTVSLTMKTDAAPDNDADPYFRTRAALSGEISTHGFGTFWDRFLARNHNYSGRPARLRRAFMPGGVWDYLKFVDEFYIIRNISRPDTGGSVKIDLEDPIKLTDRRQLPEPSQGKLAAEMALDALEAVLGSGEGGGYPVPGWVRIGREVIQYTAVIDDVLSWPDVSYRGQFGTEAKAAGSGGAVQLCKVWQNVPTTTVLRELLEAADLDDSNIDLTGFAREEEDWLGPVWNITGVISAPEQISRLLAEVTVQAGGFMWWSPSAQLVKFKVFAPVAPGQQAVADLDDTENWLEATTRVEELVKLRTTLRSLNYDLVAATADRKEEANYLRGIVFIDTVAESPNEYGDRREQKDFSRLWGNENDIAAFSSITRRSTYYRNAPLKIEGDIDGKDSGLVEGQQADVLMHSLTDFAGIPEVQRVLITRRQDRDDGSILLVARSTAFSGRSGFIGPDTIGDYPNDEEYAHIAPDENGFSDGTPPYTIY